MEENLLPKPFYLTGIPKSGERAKLFRPKELREFVFPEIGMIMYPIFWVKYTLYLIKKGYDLSEQKYLFFWAQKEDKLEPLDGVLYYSLLSKFLNQEYNKIDVSVGKRWAKWIFKDNWENNIINEIRKFTRNPNNFDYSEFVENVFSSDFKTDCSRLKINLFKQLKSEMSKKYIPSKNNNYNQDIQNAIGIFVKSLTNILVSNKELDVEEGSVIRPNINFTTKVLMNSQKDISNLSILSNTNFEFTPDELKKFISVLQNNQRGKYFVRSLLIISYFDPLNHNNEYIENKLRNVYNIYSKVSNFKEKSTKKFNEIKFDKQILDGLEQTCFYWELNYFLADGEEIARMLFKKNRGFISEKTIEEYISSLSINEIENFLEFLEALQKKERKVFLKILIEKLRNKNQNDIADFLEKLLIGIKKYKPSKIFLDLLIFQGSLEQETESLYSVTEIPEDTSSAFFYGIDPMIDWSRTVLRGLNHE